MTYDVWTIDNAHLCTVRPGPGFKALLKALKGASSAFEGAAELTLLTDGRRLVTDVSGAPLCYLLPRRASH